MPDKAVARVLVSTWLWGQYGDDTSMTRAGRHGARPVQRQDAVVLQYVTGLRALRHE